MIILDIEAVEAEHRLCEERRSALGAEKASRQRTVVGRCTVVVELVGFGERVHECSERRRVEMGRMVFQSAREGRQLPPPRLV